MAKKREPIRFVFHALIVNKGVKVYSNLSVLCDLLRMTQSPTQLSAQAKKNGSYPVVGYSNLAKSHVVITKLMIETRTTNRDREYIKLEKHYDIDYLSPDDDKIIELTKKSLSET